MSWSRFCIGPIGASWQLGNKLGNQHLEFSHLQSPESSLSPDLRMGTGEGEIWVESDVSGLVSQVL